MDHRPKHKNKTGMSLAVQWLKLHTSNTRGVGLIPGQGTKILHVKHGAAKKTQQTRKPGSSHFGKQFGISSNSSS